MSFNPGMLNSLMQLPQGAGAVGSAYTPVTDYSGIASAGIGAGGQVVNTIAQIMAQSAARQQGLQSAELGRDSDMQLAKLRIKAAADMAERERQQRAQQFLIQALGRGTTNALRAWDTNRAANKAGSSLIAQAFF